MSETKNQSTTPLVTSISDFESVLVIAKRYGVTHLRSGDLEVVLGNAVDQSPEKPEYTRSEQPNVEAEALHAYRNL